MKLTAIAATIAAAFLTEGMEDAGCTKLNKLQALALDVGGTNFTFEEGACSVDIKGPEAAQQFLTALDSEDCVEGYDVTHSGEESEDEDILALPEDTQFSITVYLGEDHVTYADEEADAEDMMEAKKPAAPAAAEITVDDLKIAKPDDAQRDVTLNGKRIGTISNTRVDGKKGFGARHINDDFEDFFNSVGDAKQGLVDAHNGHVADGHKINEQFDEAVIAEIVPVLAEAVVLGQPVDDYGVHLDEVAKKIAVTSKGVKKIKMKCPKGFKYDVTAKACVKIAGDELAVRRKASVKALVSRKAGGNALKARAAIKTKKAMNFRKAMGLK